MKRQATTYVSNLGPPLRPKKKDEPNAAFPHNVSDRAGKFEDVVINRAELQRTLVRTFEKEVGEMTEKQIRKTSV